MYRMRFGPLARMWKTDRLLSCIVDSPYLMARMIVDRMPPREMGKQSRVMRMLARMLAFLSVGSLLVVGLASESAGAGAKSKPKPVTAPAAAPMAKPAAGIE